MVPTRRTIFLVVTLTSIVGTPSVGRAESAAEFFERRVRPVLAANCISCHGPQKQESNLRLDSRAAILAGGDGGEIVVPGHPERSRLVEAIRWSADLQMPPKTRLRDDEVRALVQWISAGLPWPEDSRGSVDAWKWHWAFQPLRRSSLPSLAEASRAAAAVDYFVLQELEARRLHLSPAADRTTLIRRATFDLWGLPPTPDDVERFVTDPAANAWERLIDRLLASPHYGERWGRHWLDVARYADTKGYVFFEEKKYPWAYTYRDYVVRAWNDDLPFDQFVREQLAADLLPARGDRRHLPALGFLTVGSHFMNNTHDIIDDRIDVVARGLLGMTVTCARCHDHKYDPVPATDYYALYGVFRSCYEPIVPPLFEPPPATEEYRKFADELAKREQKLVRFVTHKHQELVTDSRRRGGQYLWAAFQLQDQPPTEDFMLLVDKGDLNPTMIVRWQVYLSRHQGTRHPVWGVWHELAALPADAFVPRAQALLNAWSSREGASPVNRILLADLASRPPTGMQDVAQRFGELFRFIEDRWQESCCEAAGDGVELPREMEDPAAEELRQVLYGEETPSDIPLAMDWGFLSLFPDRPTQGEYQNLLKELEKWLMSGPGAPPRAMVLLDDSRPHSPRVFERGNPNRLGERVSRRFLSLLAPGGEPFGRGSGRLELAEAIVDPAISPLTARVLVNRVWLHHFGQGLVRTPSDFGLRSDPPSHPELLDWLATQMVDHGWSIKWLHREIMLSSVYRQASGPVPTVDADNRLLATFPRRRLEFEALRDALLMVADSLEARLGGPPVNLLGDAVVPRRTIYSSIDRMDVPPLLTTFDFPNPLTTSPQRTATTIAPQALYLMNSGLVAEIAQRLATRGDVLALPDPNQRVTRLFQIVYGREPTVDEQITAQEFLNGAGSEEGKWRQFAHGLLLANEFVFID